MNGAIRALVINNPLSNPSSAPTPSAAATATTTGRSSPGNLITDAWSV